MEIEITDNAQSHLENIMSYSYRVWGRAKTEGYLSSIEDVIQLLSKNYQIAAKVDGFNNVYRFPVESHMIYFKVETTTLYVLAILHKSRLPYEHLLAD